MGLHSARVAYSEAKHSAALNNDPAKQKVADNDLARKEHRVSDLASMYIEYCVWWLFVYNN